MGQDKDSNLPNFTPVFIGLDEHLEQGKFTLAAHSVYCMLLRHCQWGTGVFYGCTKKLESLYGGAASARDIGDALRFLKKNGLINYQKGTGLRGNYNILIHKHINRKGDLMGYRLNAFADSSLKSLVYEWPRGGREVVVRSALGECEVDGRSALGECEVVVPIQEYNNQEGQEVKKSRSQNNNKALSSESISQCGSFDLGLVPVGDNSEVPEEESDMDTSVKPEGWGSWSGKKKADWYTEVRSGVETPGVENSAVQQESTTSTKPRTTTQAQIGQVAWTEQEKNTPAYYLWGILRKPQGSVPPKSWIQRLGALETNSGLNPEEFRQFLHWAAVDDFDPTNEKYKGTASWLPTCHDPIAKLTEQIERLLPNFHVYLRTEQVLANTTISPAQYVNKPHYMNPKYSIVAQIKKNRKPHEKK